MKAGGEQTVPHPFDDIDENDPAVRRWLDAFWRWIDTISQDNESWHEYKANMILNGQGPAEWREREALG